MNEDSLRAVGAAWLARFDEALRSGSVPAVLALFEGDGCWRDFVAFSWNVKTYEGRPAIADFLGETLERTSPRGLRLTKTTGSAGLVEVWFEFATAVGHGIGIARLADGRCRSVLTTLQALEGFEEPLGPRRPMGVRHGADRRRETWSEERAREAATLGEGVQPYCLIVGGGQGGIMLGARLRQLGVPTIITEKNARPGDSWRNRYRSLVLHDPVWYDHLPYIPFPPNWPVFTPKDKMGDFLEAYVSLMELNYWGGTRCERASFDPVEKVWTVHLVRNGKPVVLKPRQLVFATGAYGPPRRLDLPGADRYRGEFIHSSAYADARPWAGRRAVVIGAASSAHDVAVDLWEAGAEVTMVQRSPTTVVRSETLMELAFEIYSEAAVARGIDVDTADLIAMATPFALQPPVQRALCARIRERDADFYARLAATGFLLDFGEDDTGLMMKAFRTGSGYYVDVGASQLIIDGDIRVRSGVGVAGLGETGIVLSDGSELPADLVVQCTGFQSMHEVVADIVSREVADRIGPCWGLGSGVRNDPGPWQGELRNMYKPTAQEALWFHGGNLALSRFFSRILALQIKARMEGIPTPVHGAPA
jgi:putative flavoprotein involved in K+ transport